MLAHERLQLRRRPAIRGEPLAPRPPSDTAFVFPVATAELTATAADPFARGVELAGNLAILALGIAVLVWRDACARRMTSWAPFAAFLPRIAWWQCFIGGVLLAGSAVIGIVAWLW